MLRRLASPIGRGERVELEPPKSRHIAARRVVACADCDRGAFPGARHCARHLWGPSRFERLASARQRGAYAAREGVTA